MAYFNGGSFCQYWPYIPLQDLLEKGSKIGGTGNRLTAGYAVPRAPAVKW